MLTNIEDNVLKQIKQGKTIKEISNARQTTIRTTQKIIKKLKEKGVLKGSSTKGFVFQSTCPPATTYNYIRLHGQEFNIKIKYGKLIKTKSELFKGSTVRFYKKSLEIYSKQSFIGKTPYECKLKSKIYFQRYFMQLQDKLDVLFKDIKEVNAHYSEMENELAEDYNKKNKKLIIKSKKDNKTWSLIDHSLNINEFEFIHPKTAYNDTGKFQDYFNDIRDNYTYKPSEATKLISNLTKNQLMFNENLVKHMKVLDDMSLTMEAIRKALKKKSI